MSTAHADFGPDLVPSLDVRALARRAAVPAALLAVVAGVLVVADGPAQAFAGALGRALDADPRWVLAGAICEILSFGGYVALMWLVGGRASPRLGLRASAEVTFGGAAATRLLPTGGAGGAALTIWAFRRAGLGPRDATRTLWPSSRSCTPSSSARSPSAAASSPSARGGLRAPRAERHPAGRRGAGHPRRPRTRRSASRRRTAAGARRRHAPLPRRAPARRARRDAGHDRRRASATPWRSSPRATCGCSARWPGGASTSPCCGRCSRRSGRARAGGRGPGLLRRPGGQHAAAARSGERRDGRRPARLRRRGRPRAGRGARLPRGRRLASRAARPGGPRRPAPPRGPLGRRGRPAVPA
jgi:hypothetical protein